jgi:hypothetical protein
MNEDYLWDKSGQPDPQIQELEEIMGTLRYQPKPLVIPRNLVASRPRNYFPLLAIAATVLLALLAAGVWIQVRTSSESKPQQARIPATVEELPRDPVMKDSTPANKPAIKESTTASNVRRRHKTSAMKQRDREEALAAKEQLMLALRVVSEKLSLVHRKTQTTAPANQIKNQHRIG